MPPKAGCQPPLKTKKKKEEVPCGFVCGGPGSYPSEGGWSAPGGGR